MTSTADALVRKRERDEGIGTNQNAIKFGGQDYSSLKSQCLKEGVLFRDHRFPASQRSLGHDKLGPYSPDTLGLVWKRPKELYDNPRFIDDGATRTDICQGILGDCWLLASIASLTLNKQILARVVPQGQNFDKDYAGIFHFQIWQFGEWVDVVVDDRLPTRDGELLFVCSAEGSEFWSALLEKAYAKVNGSYEALIGGTTTESAVNFTGGIAEMYILDKAPPKLFRIIQKALRLGSLLGCSTDSDVNESKQLKGEHAYSLTGAQEVHVRGRTVQLVRIRNPWGHAEWTGAWSDGCESKEWGHIPAEEKAKLHHSAEDGEFWMSFVDLKKNFHVLEICNLTPDALTSDEVQQWNCYQFKGTWKVGSTAGGCLNYPDTFFSNPQYAIKLEEVDDDPEDEGGCSFLVGLMQKDCRKDQNSGRKLESIGFAIYKMPDEYKGRTNIRLGSDVLSGQCVAMTPAFTKAREVCERFCLPPGEYVIIPSTFEPNKNGTFLLRVFTEKQATTSNMEEDISAEVEEPEISDEDMDPHFKILFMHNAENDSEVSVFELVQVLNSALSQRADIKTDGFSLETCRHMVNLLDKDGSAKLGLIEFNGLWMKIQKYLKIFKRHDKDNSGTMSSHEMRGALSKAGFQINSDVLQVIVSRYADASYAIDFDCFVSCLIRLEMLFKMFKTLIRADCGMIELDLLQWLCLGII